MPLLASSVRTSHHSIAFLVFVIPAVVLSVSLMPLSLFVFVSCVCSLFVSCLVVWSLFSLLVVCQANVVRGSRADLRQSKTMLLFGLFVCLFVLKGHSMSNMFVLFLSGLLSLLCVICLHMP